MNKRFLRIGSEQVGLITQKHHVYTSNLDKILSKLRPAVPVDEIQSLLAGMGEHQVTIRDYLRHSNLSVTNKYVRAGTQAKTRAHARLVDAVGAENLGSFTEARINKRREVA